MIDCDLLFLYTLITQHLLVGGAWLGFACGTVLLEPILLAEGKGYSPKMIVDYVFSALKSFHIFDVEQRVMAWQLKQQQQLQQSQLPSKSSMPKILKTLSTLRRSSGWYGLV